LAAKPIPDTVAQLANAARDARVISMKHDYAFLSSLLLCLPLVACAGDEDDMSSSAPTSFGDTDPVDDSEGEPTTTDDPTTGPSDPTTGPTTDPTTGPTTDGPDDDTGDEGDETGDTSGALSFASDVWPIIDASCSCHKSDTPSGGLDMRAVAAYDSLVETPSVHDPNVVRVAPGEPEESFMFWKITGTQPAGQGTSMPPGGSLSTDDIDTIEQWIAEGAEP
jgi:hypothetical protein